MVIVAATNSAGSSSVTSARVGPVAAVGPTASQVKAALIKALVVSGRAAKIGQLLKHGGYTVSFAAPSGGHLAIKWYFLPKGAHIATAKHHQTKPLLAAAASVTFRRAGRSKVKITLTARGRKLLKNSKRVKLTVMASFSPTGRSSTTKTKTINLRR